MSKRTCPEGHITKDDKALKCSICGADLPPVPKKSHRLLVGIVIGIGGILLLCVIVAISSGNKSGQQAKATPAVASQAAAPVVSEATAASKPSATLRPTATLKPSPAPTDTPTPKPIAKLTYKEISDNHDNMTDAQWKAYYPPLIGQRVQWTGKVIEATENGNEGRLTVDANPSALLSGRASFDIPKADLLSYNKGQSVTFQGDIKSIDPSGKEAAAGRIFITFGITLEKVTVLK